MMLKKVVLMPYLYMESGWNFNKPKIHHDNCSGLA
jgi:hypothetical protein